MIIYGYSLRHRVPQNPRKRAMMDRFIKGIKRKKLEPEVSISAGFITVRAVVQTKEI
jgi:hypothetical protein